MSTRGSRASVERLEPRALLAVDLSLIANGLPQALANMQTAVLDGDVYAGMLPLIGTSLKNSPDSAFFAKGSADLTKNGSLPSGSESALQTAINSRLGTSVTLVSGSVATNAVEYQCVVQGTVSGTALADDLGLPGLGFKADGDSDAFAFTLNYDYTVRFGVDSNGFYVDVGQFTKDLAITLSVAPGTDQKLRGAFGLLETVATVDPSTTAAFDYAVDIRGTAGGRVRSVDQLTADSALTGNVAALFSLQSSFNKGAKPVQGTRMRAALSIDWTDIKADPADPGPLGNSATIPPYVTVRDVEVDVGSLLTSLVAGQLSDISDVIRPFKSVVDVLYRPVFPNQDVVNLRYIDLLMASLDAKGMTTPGSPFSKETILARVAERKGDMKFFDALLGLGGVVAASVFQPADDWLALGSFVIASDVRRPQDKLLLTPTPNTDAPARLRNLAKDFFDRVSSFEVAGGTLTVDLVNDPMNAFRLFAGDPSARLFSFALPEFKQQFDTSYYLNAFLFIVPVGLSFEAGVNLAMNFKAGYDAHGLSLYRKTGKTSDLLEGFFVDTSQTYLNLSGANQFGPNKAFVRVSGGVQYEDALHKDVKFQGTKLGGTLKVSGNLLSAEASLVGLPTREGRFGFEVTSRDPDDDGRTRRSEFGAATQESLACGLELFGGVDLATRIFSELSAQLQVRIDVKLGKFSWERKWTSKKITAFARTWAEDVRPLLRPELTCNGLDAAGRQDPRLATLLADGVLRLNVGEFAKERLVRGSEVNEEYLVEHVSGDPAGPAGEEITVSAFGASQTFRGVRRIAADAGAGNDKILLGAFVLSPAALIGGPDDDTLQGGAGDDSVTGSEGNDMLFGGGGTNVVIESGNVDFSLTDGTLDGLGSDKLAGIGMADLTGGPSANVFTVSRWTGVATLKAGAGADGYRVELTTDGGGRVDIADDSGEADDLTVSGTWLDDVIRATSGLIERGPQRVSYTGIERVAIRGEEEDDTIVVAGSPRGLSMSVFGDAGIDTILVGDGDIDTVQSLVTIDGGTNNDEARVIDESHARHVDYLLTPTTVTSAPSSRSVAAKAARSFGGVGYDASVESMVIRGSDGVNVFDVQPSVDTSYFVDGNLPAPGSVLAADGDFLELDTKTTFPVHPDGLDTSGRRLSMTARGAGRWEFTAGTGHQPVDFESIERFNHVDRIAVAPEAGRTSSPVVRVHDSETMVLLFEIPAAATYGEGHRDGVHVATGDLDNDGLPDVVTAPGRMAAPVIKVFNGAPILGVEGTEIAGLRLPAAATYGEGHRGGVNVAVGDVVGDRMNDIILSPDRGKAIVKVFRTRFVAGDPFSAMVKTAWRSFDAFADFPQFIGGANVATANLTGNGRSRIVVGSGSGMDGLVRVFNVRPAAPTYTASQTISGIFERGLGGVRVTAGDIDGDGRDDLVMGSGPAGGTWLKARKGGALAADLFQVQIAAGRDSTVPTRFALRDVNGDGRAEVIAAFGADARTGYRLARLRNRQATELDSLNVVSAAFSGGGVNLG